MRIKMWDNDRFYIKCNDINEEEPQYTLYDRLEEYSFNPIIEEWFVVQVRDLLNELNRENFRLQIKNGLLNDYKQDLELLRSKHPELFDEEVLRII